jgi:hypothetical protein
VGTTFGQNAFSARRIQALEERLHCGTTSSVRRLSFATMPRNADDSPRGCRPPMSATGCLGWRATGMSSPRSVRD